MKKLFLYIAFLSCAILFAQSKENDQRPPLTRILFVFDGSQSMYGRWETGAKIDVAQRLMGQMLDSLQDIQAAGNFQLALRVYGHQKPVPPQDCSDTRLEVPFGKGNIYKIKRVLKSITPRGTTPIAGSLMKAANDFTPCEDCRNIIILITDGVEACDGDPCIVSKRLQKEGIVLKPFVIGIGLDEDFKSSFECVGTYFDAADENTFKNVLGVVISQALDNTTAQINLLDIHGKPTETDVPVLLYDHTSGKIKENIIHTLNYKGLPDTLVLDPLIVYDMVVHTIPPVRVDSIVIHSGAHTHIGASTPQGELVLKASPRIAKNIACIIKPLNQETILHVQDFGTSQSYLSGTYDLEILTLPRIIQKGIHIKASASTTIAVPPPGMVTIQTGVSGYGAVFVQRETGYEWVVDLSESSERQVFQLQPGQYKVVFRSKFAQETGYSKNKEFRVSPGSSTIVKIN
ncbi:VWA domain-containing protein [Schleiferiaceae bacterium]|nr:VWA domain-containing protein [Schleiferiaceae bacterium]